MYGFASDPSLIIKAADELQDRLIAIYDNDVDNTPDVEVNMISHVAKILVDDQEIWFSEDYSDTLSSELLMELYEQHLEEKSKQYQFIINQLRSKSVQSTSPEPEPGADPKESITDIVSRSYREGMMRHAFVRVIKGNLAAGTRISSTMYFKLLAAIAEGILAKVREILPGLTVAEFMVLRQSAREAGVIDADDSIATDMRDDASSAITLLVDQYSASHGMSDRVHLSFVARIGENDIPRAMELLPGVSAQECRELRDRLICSWGEPHRQ